MYNIGDIVVVVDPGQTYSTYREMFKWFDLKNKEHNFSFAKGTVAQVINFRAHKLNYDTCVFIKDSKDNECVIGQKGLRLATIEEVSEFYSMSPVTQNKQSDEIPTIKLKKFSINII